MLRRGWYIVFGLLFLAACKEKEPETAPSHPALKAELTEAGSLRASFTVNTIDVAVLRYGCGTSPAEAVLDRSLETGSSGAVRLNLLLEDLLPITDYWLFLQGVGPDGTEGSVESIPFTTTPGADSLFPWERQRSGVPAFADMSLITLGLHNYQPPAWTEERFDAHVRYVDEAGSSHWLFDSFLCIDGWDGKRGLSYCIANGRYSAVKESWEDLLEAWLGENGNLRKLDQAIGSAAQTLGAPPKPRYVVMSLPDPVMFQYFDNKQSATDYWGSLDGKRLDFANLDDQKAAYRWYMDQCRMRFHALGLRYLELAGFYILSEELPLSPDFFKAAGASYSQADTWNWKYKRWEELVPWVAAYAHSCNEGLWWVPYFLAPGYRVWKQLGFDGAFMQPNHYWDTNNQHPIAKTVTALKSYKMGIELEFEYSLVAEVMADGRWGPDGAGNPTFTSADVPALRGRLREYFQAFRDSGGYGTLPIAVYSGTDAFHQLARSADPGDQAMYHELCHFLLDSPLK